MGKSQMGTTAAADIMVTEQTIRRRDDDALFHTARIWRKSDIYNLLLPTLDLMAFYVEVAISASCPKTRYPSGLQASCGLITHFCSSTAQISG
jgi:hypothetical protein